jgi:predicted dehydrogenase
MRAAVSAPHTLLFLDPGHFHAALTLRVPHPRVADEVVVYAPDGPELRDFLALVGRFNGRAAGPTRWRLDVVTCADPLARLVDERRGDAVVLAGRNGGKARTIRRLHEAGFHVLADKPWLVSRDDLDHVRASLGDWPLAMEIMTGRHDLPARLWQRLVSAPGVFGAFRTDGTAIELDSAHCLQKLVDGAPLRRPWWFFDVRVQGGGAVDIPTHLVDRTQWLLEGTGIAPAEVPRLLAARAWPTAVPVEAFRAITGHPAFPAELTPFLDGDALAYRCNARLEYRLGGVAARAETRWDLAPPPGGGDTSRAAAHGSRSTVRLEQSAATGHRRKLLVDPADARVAGDLVDVVAAWQAEFPGVRVERAGADGHEVVVPAALDGGHESHFAQVLDAFLTAIDERRWPAALAQRTLAKYAFLAEAAAA